MSDLLNIPHFIEAKSKRDLMRLMLDTNTKYAKVFHYYDIQKDGAIWVAWFLKKAEVKRGS